jgi:hypothetical protein
MNRCYFEYHQLSNLLPHPSNRLSRRSILILILILSLNLTPNPHRSLNPQQTHRPRLMKQQS